MTNETVLKDILDKLNAGVPVTATDLDIRDLTSVSDSVEVKQATATNLKAEVVNPSGVGIQVLSYGSSDGGTTWYPLKVDTDGHLQVDVLVGAGIVPVGAVLSWLKTYTNTPTLPTNFVECNGQTLSDAASVYDGQVIPDLNGNNNFLRGNSTSGGTGGASTNDLAHTHDVSGTSGDESSHTHDLPYGLASSTYIGFHTTASFGTGANITVDRASASAAAALSIPSYKSQTGSAHSHSFSDTSDSKLSATQENKPPYYDIVWIMRIK